MSAWSTRYPMQFEEGVDYYEEKGTVVMTEKFHRDRGYCCGSGCRHCPYKTKQQKMKELMQRR
jgi:hypothetical protein